jgi:hypothetical protein
MEDWFKMGERMEDRGLTKQIEEQTDNKPKGIGRRTSAYYAFKRQKPSKQATLVFPFFFILFRSSPSQEFLFFILFFYGHLGGVFFLCMH